MKLKYGQVGPDRDESPPKKLERQLLFAVLAAPIAWSIHEVTDVSVLGRRCEISNGLLGWQWAVLIGVGSLSFIVAALGLYTSIRAFRSWTHEAPLFRSDGTNRVSFMALIGLFVSIILLGSIVYFGLEPWLVHPCASDVALNR